MKDEIKDAIEELKDLKKELEGKPWPIAVSPKGWTDMQFIPYLTTEEVEEELKFER